MENHGERIARVEVELRELSTEVARLDRMLNNGERSVRGRLHTLETDSAAAKAASAALETAKAMQAQMKGQSFDRRQKRWLFGFAAVGALGTVVSIAVLVLTAVFS